MSTAQLQLNGSPRFAVDLALDHEKLKRLPRQVQELSGWFLSQPNVGSVDFKHPLNKLGHDIAYTDEALYEVGAVA